MDCPKREKLHPRATNGNEQRMNFTITSSFVLALSLFLVFNMGYDIMKADEPLVHAFRKETTTLNTNLRAMEMTSDFQTSEIPTFLSTLKMTSVPKEKKIVLDCGRRCSGIADRVRGIPFVVGLAAATDREFLIDRSLLSYGMPSSLEKSRYVFRDVCSKPEAIEKIKDILNDTSPTIFIMSTCYILPQWREILPEKKDDRLSLLEGVNQDCNAQFESAYLCGAAAIHQAKGLTNDILEAHRVVDALDKILPKRNYTVLQIRAGGSNVSIENTSVKALPWGDDYISEVPNMWIQAFRAFTFSACKSNLAIVSDSARIMAEIRYVVGDGLIITHCCNQPLHRDRTKRQEFFWQEVIDLFIMSRSRQILAGNGNFVTLGRNWLGKNGPELKRARTEKEIHAAVLQLLKDSQCEDIKEK